MQILVAILTRGRPAALTSLIYSLYSLATDSNRVKFAVRSDDDDMDTWSATAMLARELPNVIFSYGPRYPGLGKIWNETIASTKYDWDVCYLASDGVVPLTLGWDCAVEEGFKTSPAAISWRELNDPQNVTHPIISRKWYDAVAGKLCPEFYPFWFNDTFLDEVHELAFNRSIPIDKNLWLGGKRGVTGGMRDVAYWFQFFAATRSERADQGKRVAAAFGVPSPALAPLLKLMEQRDMSQQDRVSLYEQAFQTDRGPPSKRYLDAKKTAEDWLATITHE